MQRGGAVMMLDSRLVLIGLLVALTAFAVMPGVNAAWWNSTFDSKIRVDTNYNISSNTINPILLNGTYGVNLTPFINLEVMQDDCDDLRILNFDEDTQIPFELVNNTCGDNTEIWFSPSLSASNLSFYLYFNNGDAGSVSTGDIWAGNTSLVYHMGYAPFENNSAGGNGTVNLPQTGYVPFAPAGQRNIGQARVYNFSNNHGFVSNDLIDFIQAVNITIEAWINVTGHSNPGDHYIFSAGNSSREGAKMTVIAAGNAACSILSTADSSQTITSASILQPNTFNHIVCSTNGTAINLYINGTLDKIEFGSGNPFMNSNYKISLGQPRSLNAGFNGSIDDIQVWNISKSTAQILEAFNNRLNNRGIMDLNDIEDFTPPATNLTDCTLATETAALNFTLRDEADLTANIYGDLEIAFTEVFKNNQSNATNFSFGYTNQSSFEICLATITESYNVTATLHYKNVHGGDNEYNFRPRTYYLTNHSVNNITQNTTLLSISNASSSLVTINLIDSTNIPVENAYINVLRHYVDEDIFRTVAVLRSDFDGKGVTYLDLDDIFYKFTIFRNQIVLEDIDPTFITATTLNIQISPTDLGEVYNIINDITSSCSYSGVSENLTCSVIDNIGTSRDSCLRVEQIVDLGKIDVCNDFCSTGNSVTIVCNVGNISQRTFYYALTTNNLTGTHRILLQNGYLEGDLPTNVYGPVGLLVALFTILFMGLIGRGPSMVIINGIIGVGLMVAFSFINLAWSGVVGLALAGVFLIYVIRR